MMEKLKACTQDVCSKGVALEGGGWSKMQKSPRYALKTSSAEAGGQARERRGGGGGAL